MMLEITRKQRNYNYLSLIKKYNSLFREKKNTGEISKSEFYDLCSDLIGEDSIDNISESIVLSENNIDDNSLELLSPVQNSKDKYIFLKQSEILLAPSKEEVSIIYSMLKNGDFDLFLDKEKAIIEDNIETFFQNIGKRKFDLFGLIEVKGKSKEADTLNSIRDVFQKLHNAMQNKKSVSITYSFNNKEYINNITPFAFVFSQLDQKMRVRAYLDGEKVRTYYLSYIKEVRMIEDIPQKDISHPTENVLKFSFENKFNLAERVAARFSDYDKSIIYDRKNNIISYSVKYPSNPLERNRIMNRLLSLGKKINIESQEKEEIRTIAKKALENY